MRPGQTVRALATPGNCYERPLCMPKASTTVPPQPPSPASIALPEKLNQKQQAARRSRTTEANLKLRAQLWPEVKDSELWRQEDRSRKGFVWMPRAMPYFINLINDLSKKVGNGKSAPAGRSYLALWCRVRDGAFLKIDSDPVAALEAGYTGERNVTTWREHLRLLKELGFIDYKPGAAGPCQFVLLWNPYRVVKELYARGWIQETAYTALLQRSLEIGATDLDEV